MKVSWGFSVIFVGAKWLKNRSLGCRITIRLHLCFWGTTTHTSSPLKMALGSLIGCPSLCVSTPMRTSTVISPTRHLSRLLSPKTWKSGTWEQIGDGGINPGPSEVWKTSTSLHSQVQTLRKPRSLSSKYNKSRIKVRQRPWNAFLSLA